MGSRTMPRRAAQAVHDDSIPIDRGRPTGRSGAAFRSHAAPAIRTSSARRALLGPEAFERVITPLVGRRVGYLRPEGHVGTALTELAMAQLFGEFGVGWQTVDLDHPADVDVLVFGGGGMGRRLGPNHAMCSRGLAAGPPLVILPQSFVDRQDGPFEAVFVRERSSLGLRPDGILAPDLALGLAWPAAGPPLQEVGILLRRDHERIGRRLHLARDPAAMCRTPAESLALAARYRRIVTDRLHCAIAGLHAGREVTLLPTNNHRNRSMHETWLAGLGCRFAESVEAALVRHATGARCARRAAA